ncbi:MAG: amidohydrolase family protein, partial [Gammaproteobacteria bacterium]
AMDPAGIDGLARQTAEAGVWNVPTQSLFESTLGPASLEELRQRPGMDLLSAETLERWERSVQELRERITEEDRRHFLTIRRALIAALQDAGAGLLLGSDAPQIMNVPGYSVHQELQHLVASGLTPLEALQTGTVNVARFFGEDDRGRIAPGHVADFVLLGANPLQDIGNTTAILGVAREGRWLDRPALDRLIEGVRSRGL